MRVPSIRENYKELTNEELLAISADRSSLVPEAAVALDDELRERCLVNAEARSASEWEDRSPQQWNKRARWFGLGFGASLALFVILAERYCGIR